MATKTKTAGDTFKNTAETVAKNGADAFKNGLEKAVKGYDQALGRQTLAISGRCGEVCRRSAKD